MKSLIVGLAFAASATVASAQMAPVTTQGHGSFYLGPYAGYMYFGNLQDYGNGRSLSLENGFFYGAQAGYSFSPNVALLANLGYSNSKLVNKESSQAGSGSNINESQNIGTYLYDGDIQFKLPFLANSMGTSIAPFVQAGLGQIKYTYNSSKLTASTNESDTKFTYNVGAGVDIQVRPLIGVRLMVKDYITSLDFNKYYNITSGSKSNTANNLALTAGLNFGF
jgi:opacity protein-like surface antigen